MLYIDSSMPGAPCPDQSISESMLAWLLEMYLKASPGRLICQSISSRMTSPSTSRTPIDSFHMFDLRVELKLARCSRTIRNGDRFTRQSQIASFFGGVTWRRHARHRQKSPLFVRKGCLLSGRGHTDRSRGRQFMPHPWIQARRAIETNVQAEKKYAMVHHTINQWQPGFSS